MEAAQAERRSLARPQAPPLPGPPAPGRPSRGPCPDFKSKLRRSKVELTALKAQLVKTLQLQGALSSFQAQEELGLKTCEWAPATLRRFFSELEDEGVILKQGQKRGTRYVWRGITNQPATGRPPGPPGQARRRRVSGPAQAGPSPPLLPRSGAGVAGVRTASLGGTRLLGMLL